MALAVLYVVLVVAGDFLAYFIGLFIESRWGGNVSMIAFLVMYFIVLWLAWQIAVRLTAPKAAASGASP